MSAELARARFEVLIMWQVPVARGVPAAGLSVRHAWHMARNRLRWSGTFDDARAIVRDKYGPARGTDAVIVVRVDEA